MTAIRSLIAVVSLLLLLPIAPFVQIEAAAAAPSRGVTSPSIVRLPPPSLPAPRTVNLRAVGKRGAGLRTNQRWLTSARTIPRVATTVAPSSTAPASPGAPRAVEATSIVGGLSLGQNESLYGPDQDVEPADAQVAVSPSQIVEVAGNTMAVLSPAGYVRWSVDLQTFFGLPADYFFYGASLQFDYSGARWFLGGIASNTTNHTSWLLLAVSRSIDASGSWSLTITDVFDNNPSQCVTPCPNTIYFLRESIAVTNDKVIQANQPENCAYGCNPETNAYPLQGGFLVMRKDQLMAGALPTVDRFTFPGLKFVDLLAVQPQSLGVRGYLVWLKAGGSITQVSPDRLGLLEVVGLPNSNRFNSFNGTTTVWEKDYSMAVMPPLSDTPPQPGGRYLSASPTPITSAVYRDGQVVVGINDQCHPNNGQASCVRIIKTSNIENATEVANDDPGPTGATVPNPIPTDLDVTIGHPSDSLFDPSLAVDPYENLFITAAYSSPTDDPGIAITGISAPISLASTIMPASRIAQGPGSYVSCGPPFANYWGAYMRSVPDANNWTHVWMPGEASLGSCDWVTAISSVTMGVPPQVTRMSPTFGSTKGGQQVEIDGSQFVPDSDEVFFGPNAGRIDAEASDGILVSTPPGSAGTVAVTVQTPDGSAVAGTFTYVTPGTRISPPPAPSARYRF